MIPPRKEIPGSGYSCAGKHKAGLLPFTLGESDGLERVTGPEFFRTSELSWGS